MSQLVDRVLGLFPEPTFIFDRDDLNVVHTNHAVLDALKGRGITYDDLDGMPAPDLVRAYGVAWDGSVVEQIATDERAAGSYRGEIRSWVIGSRLTPTSEGLQWGLVTLHRQDDEAAAWLQHTCIHGFVEFTLYIADVRESGETALRLVHANFEQLQRLESTLLRMVDDIGSFRLRP